ncbi:gamma-glutamylcyclotransferase family protein [Sediminicola arcticus]|uniref:Gamma-glutamylcyclotransferase family protein n=1 Tax=Sediminicola arcticus TaxID=1574308 RepID=A0ABV2SXK1_9FLAO
MKDLIQLFTYGTLQDQDIQLQLFGRVLSGEPDILIRYQLSKKKIMGRYTVIHKTNDPINRLEGIRYSLALQELLDTDTYEGEAYKRILVTLASGKKAWVYVENYI